mmetsp:Transcript_29267/g.40565  ORF Transcript_29267/g.40565 Transcript_29267/m.40565 type:complete len:422 (-) Transcript_29267:287-1552(-)
MAEEKGDFRSPASGSQGDKSEPLIQAGSTSSDHREKDNELENHGQDSDMPPRAMKMSANHPSSRQIAASKDTKQFDVGKRVTFQTKSIRKSASAGSFSALRELEKSTGNLSMGEFTSLDEQEREGDALTPEVKKVWEKGRKERWWVSPSEFKIPEKEMASGACGKVYVTKWRSLRVAVKTIKKATSRKELEDLQQEIQVWSTTRHPNVVTFMGASYNPHNGVMLIMEFMKGGDLQQLIDRTGGPIPRKRAYQIALDIGKALCFLHACHPPIIHRDLKPPNVLFDAHGVAKLADFGLSKFVNSRLESYQMTAKTGTVRYMAPEVLLGRKYSVLVDVYSFGMIMSYMISGTRPFAGFDVKKRVLHAEQGVEVSLPINLTQQEKALIRQCVSSDPNMRLNVLQITEHLEMLHSTRSPGACCVMS